MDNKYKKIYRHLFIVYTTTIIIAIGLLNLYFLKYSADTKKETELYINQQLVGEVTSKVDNTFLTTDLIADSIYSYRDNILDLLKFISIDFNSYKEQKLDTITNNAGISYSGTEVLFERSFNSYNNLFKISTISKKRNEVRIFNRNTQIDFRSIDNYDEISKQKIICWENTITHIIKINDITNLNEEGLLCLTYNLTDINNILKKYEDYYDVFVFSGEDMIYKSSDSYDEKLVSNIMNLSKSKQLISKMASEYYNLSYMDDITIVGRVTNNSRIWLAPNFYIMLIAIDLIIFAIAELVIYLKIKKLNLRIENIVHSMEAVEKGNLDVRIEVKNDDIDELNYISSRFNEMCRQLDTHIKKSYIAEINQKNAEMKQLQSQINPHFLYNTLEVIRMKAICSGNKDVGKMLYNLAVLFRSQLKESDVITIQRELDYCKKYLELFKLRYDERFSYEIICNKELVDCNIIKFILQPIIENYVVHGVRLSENDNKLEILVSSDGDDINIYINDNGIGISHDKLCEIEKKLSDKNHKSDSIGITNVNQRIKNTYGQFYGLKFVSDMQNGTSILIKIPKTKGD